MLVCRFRLTAALAAASFVLALAPAAHAQVPPQLNPGKKRAGPAAEVNAGKEGTEVTPAPNRQLDAAARAKVKYHMDFDKVDILEVIKYISQWTGKNFILPDNVRGKITIIGPTDVTTDEAYNAFVAALETNNLTVTPTGKFLKIVPKKDGIRTRIPTYLNGEPPPMNESMVTKLFRMKYSEADPIKNVIQQFITREGEIVPYPPDVLIVSDDGQNLARIDEIIAALDTPGSQDEVNVLTVEHANAQELSNLLLQIFQPQAAGGAPGQRRPSLAAPVGMPKEPGAVAGGEAAGGTSKDTGSTVSKIIPDERTNKLIIIGSPKTFERIKELAKKLDIPTDTGQVHVYYLENADAEELAGTLGNLASGTSGGSSKRGGRAGAAAPAPAPAPGGGAAGAASAALFSGEVKVTAEKSTNSLLIIASPSDYRNMVKVIQQLDVRRRQVFIEAVIMEVKLNGENRAGVDIHSGYAFTDVQLPGTDKGVAPLIVGSEVSNPGASLNLAGLASLSGFLAGIQGPPIKVDGINVTLPSFGVVLNALQKNSDVNVISTPHIMTSDNEDAEISVGSSVPFQTAVSSSLGGLSSLAGLGGLGSTGLTGTSATTATGLLGGLGGLGLGGFGLGGIVPVQRQPVELRLKIKPQVNESDFVKLDIDVQNEEISSIDPQRGPTTSKRTVKTTVVSKDQSTVVIGGLIQERTTRGDTKVPILGSMPILGALFRNTSVVRERTNLLVFLTPYIIRDQSDFRRIFERKMKERQEFVARFFGATDQYAVTVDYERKKGPLAILRKAVKDESDKAENGGAGAPGERIITPNSLENSAPANGNGNDKPVTLPPASPAPAPAPEAAPVPPPDTAPPPAPPPPTPPE